MPTATKLMSALLVAGLLSAALLLAQRHVSPIELRGPYWAVPAIWGVLCGWIMIPPRTGKSVVWSINAATLATLFAVIWTIVTFGFAEMLLRSLRGQYRDFGVALEEALEFMVTYATPLAQPEVWATLLIGAVIVGILTEAVARRWR